MSTYFDYLLLCNKVLAKCQSQCVTVETGIKGTFPDNVIAQEKVTNQAVATAQKIGLSGAYGSIIKPPAQLVEEFLPEASPSDRVRVLEILKDTHRFLQVGAGKGKMTIVTTCHLITAEEFLPRNVDVDDPLGLSKALKNCVQLLIDDNNHLKTRITELEKEVINLTREKDELASRVQSKHLMSWT